MKRKISGGAKGRRETEEFEQFMFQMDDVLELFLAKNSSYGLDYSVASLARLERLLLDESRVGDELLVTKNRAARYLGEVFRRNVGGVWDVCLHPRHLYYGLPIVTGYSSHRLEFCPTEAVISFLRTRELGFFARVLVGDMQHSDFGRVLPKEP